MGNFDKDNSKYYYLELSNSELIKETEKRAFEYCLPKGDHNKPSKLSFKELMESLS